MDKASVIGIHAGTSQRDVLGWEQAHTARAKAAEHTERRALNVRAASTGQR